MKKQHIDVFEIYFSILNTCVLICLLSRLLLVTFGFSSKQRNSHWRVQSVVSPPQAMKNGSGPVSSYPGKLEENSTGTTSNMLASSQNTSEIDPGRDLTSKFMVQQSEVAKQAMHVAVPVPVSVRSDDVISNHLQRPFPDAQPMECTADTAPDHQEDLTIEGGTISISSVYSQG